MRALLQVWKGLFSEGHWQWWIFLARLQTKALVGRQAVQQFTCRSPFMYRGAPCAVCTLCKTSDVFHHQPQVPGS